MVSEPLPSVPLPDAAGPSMAMIMGAMCDTEEGGHGSGQGFGAENGISAAQIVRMRPNVPRPGRPSPLFWRACPRIVHPRICRNKHRLEGYDERDFTTSFYRQRGGRLGDPADRVFSPCADRLANRPIKIIAGYPAGGQTDLFARTYGEYIRSETGQNVTVENKAGASGIGRGG